MDALLNNVRAILNTTPTRWLELSQALPLEMLTQAPAPGEWSPLECLQHMVDTEKVFQFRLNAFLEGRDFAAFDPDSEGTRLENPSPADLAAQFARLRDTSLIALSAITPADFPRPARHPELGPVTLEQMINEWAAHDLNHTVQAERAMMQPFLQACGPWQVYFTDHMMKG